MPTKIEWVKDADGNQGETWTPIRARNRETGKVGHFCIHASPGCANCYAERMQPRFGNPVRFAAQDADKVELFLDLKMLTQPLRWKRPRTIFVCSMTDLFLESVPNEWIQVIFGVMLMSPHHRFQVLTKRADRMRSFMTWLTEFKSTSACVAELLVWQLDVAKQWPLTAERAIAVGKLGSPPSNIWLGVSAEDQKRAEERIPVLLDTPAAVRFVSLEPLLGGIDLTRLEMAPDQYRGQRGYRAGIRVDALRNKHVESGVLRGLGGLDWVIVGGESGKGARPMHPDWARSLRDQCLSASVPFHFKQWGEYAPVRGDPPDSRYPLIGFGDWTEAPASLQRFGKKAAGRTLDGRTWDEMPT